MRFIFLLAFVSSGALAQSVLVPTNESVAAQHFAVAPDLAELHRQALNLSRLDRVN